MGGAGAREIKIMRRVCVVYGWSFMVGGPYGWYIYEVRSKIFTVKVGRVPFVVTKR